MCRDHPGEPIQKKSSSGLYGAREKHPAGKKTCFTNIQKFSSGTAGGTGSKGKQLTRFTAKWPLNGGGDSGSSTHTTVLRPLFQDHPRQPEEILFRSLWCKMVQGKIMQADTLTIRLGATPSGLISNPPPSSPHFYAGFPSCCNPPNIYWLGTGTKYAGLHTQWLGLVRGSSNAC